MSNRTEKTREAFLKQFYKHDGDKESPFQKIVDCVKENVTDAAILMLAREINDCAAGYGFGNWLEIENSRLGLSIDDGKFVALSVYGSGIWADDEDDEDIDQSDIEQACLYKQFLQSELEKRSSHFLRCQRIAKERGIKLPMLGSITMKHDEEWLNKAHYEYDIELYGNYDHEQVGKLAKNYAEHMNRWRSVDEEQPPTDKPFLSVVEGFVYIAEYEEIYDADTDVNSNTPTYWIAEHRDRNIKVASGRLTHWQDLIEPPET